MGRRARVAARGRRRRRGRDGAAFGAVWGGAQMMLPALDVAPPPWESPKQEVLIDAFHHAVYAIATGVAFATLQRGAS